MRESDRSDLEAPEPGELSRRTKIVITVVTSLSLITIGWLSMKDRKRRELELLNAPAPRIERPEATRP